MISSGAADRTRNHEVFMPAKRYRFVPPGGGLNYDWTRDHTYVKVAAADTSGAYAMMEDNLKREFALGLHLHRQHAETFYILDGVVNFYLDGEWMAAAPGACVHRPACRTRSICRPAAPAAA
jgi:mannose-6-phosphate isomerase-like protein (cupin superfamily)